MNAVSTLPAPPFFAIRAGRPTDTAYIVENWYSSARQGHDGGPLYTAEFKAHVNSVLSAPTTEVRVAGDAEDDDAIHGWAIVAHVDTLAPLVHFVFVREDSRRLGVARSLVGPLSERPCIYTHRPRACGAYRLDETCTLPTKCLAHKLPKPEGWLYSAFQGFKL